MSSCDRSAPVPRLPCPPACLAAGGVAGWLLAPLAHEARACPPPPLRLREQFHPEPLAKRIRLRTEYVAKAFAKFAAVSDERTHISAPCLAPLPLCPLCPSAPSTAAAYSGLLTGGAAIGT